MKLLHAIPELPGPAIPVCLAIGVFDGLHLGHQKIIRQTIADARETGAHAVVVTFDRHPSAIVAPEREPGWIYSPNQKFRVLAALGADATLVLTFDEAFSRQTGSEFIHLLARSGRLQSISVGANFVFGCKRSGNVALLEQLGQELGFKVRGLPAVDFEGQAVSSTRIREQIRAGHLAAASQMLGRPYSLSGRVETGDQLGRTLDFPTANLAVAGLNLPPNGVYAGRTRVGDRDYLVALNLGRRPTLGNPQPVLRVEAHLLDFSGDLYGQDLEVEVGPRLREEQKFASLGELKQQINRDVARIRALAAGATVPGE